MLVFTRAIRVPDAAGTLTDADSTPTIKIIRTDTSAIVVADGTATTRDSTGRYSYELDSTVNGVTYRATWAIVVNGRTITTDSEKTAGDDTASWYYASQQDVEDLIGVTALQQISNEPGAASDADTNTARLQRIGEDVDAYINRRMFALGYVAPMTGMDDDTERLMKGASARLVAWTLNEPRMLLTITGSRQASSIDKIMMEHRRAAEATFRAIGWKQLAIVADKLYPRGKFAEVHVPTAGDMLATAEAKAIQVQ